MAQIDPRLSTGLAGVDRMLTGLIPGDNIVWRVTSIDDYVPFVGPYVTNAVTHGKGLVYFRFARHAPLVEPGPGIATHVLRPEDGFEALVSEIHEIIGREGAGRYYLFDLLSDLASDWYSDQMLGNFFMLICPYLYDVGAIAYFALLQGHHSREAVDPVAETAQVLVDVFHRGDDLYVHPVKVQQRYAPTMYMLHVREADAFRPVTLSATISEIMAESPRTGVEQQEHQAGIVNRTVLEAETLVAAGRGGAQGGSQEEVRRRLLRMAISRDERVLALVEKYLSLEDVLQVKRRMIGSGLVGGKSVGMLLARAILEKKDPGWSSLLEPHDSFYVGSDVYYTFVVRNGLWWLRERQKDPAAFLEGAERARQRMLVGTFPDYVVRQFRQMLDYFGQSPMIVRSSSLLEDNFGNSFAGKYESVFCVNQGPPERRLDDFLAAVRTIYASTMSQDALTYRAERGLLHQDEQMALLIQRVSGGMYGDAFYPQIAGVGLSYNPYIWSDRIDPAAGMLRLVFGLGTRAVDRSDDDYTRIVALNAPERRPESTSDAVRRYSQKRVDVLDLNANQLVSRDVRELLESNPDLPLEMVASRDLGLERQMREAGRDGVFSLTITFDRLLAGTRFVADMRRMLALLQETYRYPVDVEFTANFSSVDTYRINVLQCRPLQVKGVSAVAELPDIPEADVVLKAQGAVIGQSRVENVGRLVYVVPSVYGHMPLPGRHAVARLIGRIARLERQAGMSMMLVGPGRWGTTTPSLGIPVKFGEINTVRVLVELVELREGLVPDVSLGSHYFNELVERDVLYVALFPDREENVVDYARLVSWPNRLAELLPEEADMADAVRVVDIATLPGRPVLRIYADAMTQRAVCWLERSPARREPAKRAGKSAPSTGR